MDFMHINSNTYVIAIDNTNKSATFTDPDTNTTSVILYNGSTNAVFVETGDTAPTVAFPTSATIPMRGKVIAPGATMTYIKSNTHKYLSAIQATTGTGSLYIAVGAGE